MDSVVSIIVPVYNIKDYLRRCVESILKQTYRNIELILVDDGSSDGSAELCDELKAADSRICTIHQENRGVGPARNTGIRHAHGSFLMFVDSDDFIADNAVEILVNRLITDKSDMAIGRHTDFYDNGSTNGDYCRWMENSVIGKDDVFGNADQKRRFPVAVWAKLYRSRLFEGLKFEPFKCGEDLMIFPHIIDRCNRISIVNEVVYYYYQRNASIMHAPSKESLMDELRATVCYTDFLVNGGYAESSIKWFERAVSKAYAMNSRDARDLFADKLLKADLCRLWKKCGSRSKLKWICISIPIVGAAVRYIKGSNSK